MIAQVCRRGQRVSGLLYYLFREGLAGERGLSAAHTDPRVVAGFDEAALLSPGRRADGRWDLADLVALLEQPLLAAGVPREARGVYHLVVAAAKDPVTKALTDPLLSDAQWADIAGEYVHRLGLARRDDPGGARWVAVRHADDHVHVVVTLARQDGRRVHPRNDFYRALEVSADVERRYRLTVAAPGDRTAVRRATRAEQERAAREQAGARGSGRAAQGRGAADAPTVTSAVTDRERLRRAVRTAAGGAAGWEEFSALLAARGVLVRLRYSEREPGTVTGYAVALPSRGAGEPVWFGGGRLAADLTLPRLRGRWQDVSAAGVPGEISARRGGREEVWRTATAAVQAAAGQVRHAVDSGDWATAADVCWATTDLLEVTAAVSGPSAGPLRRAASAYERAGRELWGRQPTSSSGGRAVRQAARRLHALNTATRGDAAGLAELTRALRGVLHNVAVLRSAQGRLAQAQAARTALAALEPAAVSGPPPTSRRGLPVQRGGDPRRR